MMELPLPKVSAGELRPGLNDRAYTEAIRTRELYRYYQPPSGPGDVVSGTVGGSQIEPITSNDPSLMAYAQLTAIRLDCRRSMISLMNESTQFVIAECTQTVSPLSPLDHGPGDSLWLGGAEVIPRFGGLCENTVMLDSGAKIKEAAALQKHEPHSDYEMAFFDADDDIDSLPMYEVEDLSRHEKFCNFPYVAGQPGLRYYCGVPLRTRKGYHIGSLCVVDERTKKLDATQKRMLRWMANTVMAHLEMVAEKRALKRVQRMQSSLSHFVAGEWSESCGIKTPRQRTKQQLDVRRGKTLAPKGYASPRSNSVRGDKMKKDDNSVEKSRNSHDKHPSERPGIIDRNSSTSTAATLDSNSSYASSATNVSVEPILPQETVEEDEVPPIPEYSFQNIFVRGTSLIREALEIEGTVFVDAERHWSDLAPLDMPSKHDLPHLPPIRQSHTSANSRSSPTHIRRKGSSVLAYATENACTTPVYTTSKPHTPKPSQSNIDPFVLGSLPERSLQLLFQMYPEGKILNYDRNGGCITDDEDELTSDGAEPNTEAKLVYKRRRDDILRELTTFLPASTSCIFVPLFDHSSKAFAACFAWTTSKTRIFRKDELGYLTAFSNSIMSEMSRIELGLADKAKGNFISSISHELRSPLHGILASAEFLSDTSLDTFQGSLVETVESCGRTLLDTINHVLDFSKLNSLHNDVKSKSSGPLQKRKKLRKQVIRRLTGTDAAPSPPPFAEGESLASATEINIAAVTEEVVEGVFAGYEFRGINTITMMENNSSDGNLVPLQPETIGPSLARSRASSRDTTPLLTGKKDDISVVFEIDQRKNWNYVVQPGAYRRILMNVFGNALKYTNRGYVRVRLEAEDYADSEDISDTDGEDEFVERTLVTLTVQDSGRGISREFLKTKLFTPFSQENTLASGAGLGMSIVRQIVEILGGEINVQSELGVGTEVKITFVFEHRPLVADPASPPLIHVSNDDGESHDYLTEVQTRARGKRIAVVGFDSESLDPVQHDSMIQLRLSFEKYAKEWYGMTIVPTLPNATLSDYKDAVDVILANESAPLLLQLQSRPPKPPIIILCSNAARYGMYTSQADQGGIIDFASKPCGPHKLAKALYFCLYQAEVSRRSSNSSGKSSVTVTGGGRPSLDRGRSFQGSFTPTTEEEESSPAGTVRISPPVRVGSHASDSMVYVPGLGMLPASTGSSVVPLNRHQRTTSMTKMGELQGVPLSDRASTQSSLDNVHNIPPEKGKEVACGMTPAALDQDIMDRPPFASPVAEKDNPLRPKSWNNWQSLNAQADRPGLSRAEQSIHTILASSRKPSKTPVIEKPVDSIGISSRQIVPTVLIVEDNPINLMLLATFMSKHKYPFQKAENGLLAYEAFEKMPNGFDVVIMDIQMPIMTGLEATAAIRNLEKERKSPHKATIIALTGLAAANDQIDAFKCGVDYFVTKPISMKKIQQYLDQRRDQMASNMT